MRHRRFLTAIAMAVTAGLLGTVTIEAAAAPFPDPGYQFTQFQSDGFTPVALTCQSHPVVVNTNGGDPNLLAQAKKAIARTAATSGINLYYAGTTAQNWSSPNPSIASLATTPIRLSFEPETSIPTEYSGAIGLASVPTLLMGGRRQAPWFKVLINVDTYQDSQTASGQAEADRQLYTTLIHELGHGVGLDHTGDETQIMYFADTPELTEYGQGDLTGLRMLGQTACSFNQVAGPSAPKKIKKSTTIHKKKKKKRKKRKKRKHRSAQHRIYVADASQSTPVVHWSIHE